MKFTISRKQQDVLRYHIGQGANFTQEERDIVKPFYEQLEKQHQRYIEQNKPINEDQKFKLGELVEIVKYLSNRGDIEAVVGIRKDKKGIVWYAVSDKHGNVNDCRQHCLKSTSKYLSAARLDELKKRINQQYSWQEGGWNSRGKYSEEI